MLTALQVELRYALRGLRPAVAASLGLLSACSPKGQAAADDWDRLASTCDIRGELRDSSDGSSRLVVVEEGVLSEVSPPRYGVVFTGDSSAFGFAPDEANVIQLTFGDSLARSRFGRDGQGPGEFVPRGGVVRLQAKLRVVDWVDRRGDSVGVFDGRRLQFFDSLGRYLGENRAVAESLAGPPLSRASRVRLTSDGALVDFESLTLGVRTTRGFALWRFGARDVSKLMEYRLPDPPVRKEGGVYLGPQEAVVLWDLLGRCVVSSDGGSGSLKYMRSDVRSSIDSISIPLPTRPSPTESEEIQLLRRLGSPQAPPPPVVPRVIQRLVVDPSGAIWLLGNQPDGLTGRVEVIRADVRSRRVVVDTTPAFPVAFGPSGRILGFRPDSVLGYAYLWLRSTPRK